MLSLASAVRFTDDATALEKTLRLLQGMCTVIVGLNGSASAEIVAPWMQARSQLALGRRYFRLLKWHTCWELAYESLGRDEDALMKLLEVGKFSFLGLYYFLEMPTITDAMGVTNYAWSSKLQNEANKCWFYAISFSLMLSLYQLLAFASAVPTAQEQIQSHLVDQDEKRVEATTRKAAQKEDRSKTFIQLAIDSCDLFIPGASVGWFPVGHTVVGAAQTISSALAAQQIWRRVQSA